MASGKSKHSSKLFKRARRREQKRADMIHAKLNQQLQDAVSLDSVPTLEERNYLDITYTVTRDPLPDSPIFSMSDEDRSAMNRGYEILRSNPRRAVPIYERLAAKYPNNPSIANNLLVAKGIDDSGAIVAQIERFPDYLFAKTNYGHFLLRENRAAELPNLLRNKFKLNDLYPERKLFHISEHLAFLGLLAMYFLKLGRFTLAFEFYTTLMKWDEDFPIEIGLSHALFTHPLMTLMVEKLADDLHSKRRSFFPGLSAPER